MAKTDLPHARRFTSIFDRFRPHLFDPSLLLLLGLSGKLSVSTRTVVFLSIWTFLSHCPNHVCMPRRLCVSADLLDNDQCSTEGGAKLLLSCSSCTLARWIFAELPRE